MATDSGDGARDASSQSRRPSRRQRAAAGSASSTSVSSATVLAIAAGLSLAVLAALCGVLALMNVAKTLYPEFVLPVVILASVVILLICLGGFAIIFKRLGIANDSFAMGLPDGSIRAIIAVLLIVMFSVIAVFLVNLSNQSGPSRQINGVSAQYADAIPADQVLERVRNGGTDQAPLYDLTLVSPRSPASTDLAKQLLTTLGTLVVAIAAFYFGAKSVTTAMRVRGDGGDAGGALGDGRTGQDGKPGASGSGAGSGGSGAGGANANGAAGTGREESDHGATGNGSEATVVAPERVAPPGTATGASEVAAQPSSPAPAPDRELEAPSVDEADNR